MEHVPTSGASPKLSRQEHRAGIATRRVTEPSFAGAEAPVEVPLSGHLSSALPWAYLTGGAHMVSLLIGTAFLTAAGAVVWQMLNTQEPAGEA